MRQPRRETTPRGGDGIASPYCLDAAAGSASGRWRKSSASMQEHQVEIPRGIRTHPRPGAFDHVIPLALHDQPFDEADAYEVPHAVVAGWFHISCHERLDCGDEPSRGLIIASSNAVDEPTKELALEDDVR